MSDQPIAEPAFLQWHRRDELRLQQRVDDPAVMRAYGFPEGLTESEIVARLFALYAKLTEK